MILIFNFCFILLCHVLSIKSQSFEAQLSQMSNMGTFYWDELLPMLEVRVAGTQGNMLVQEHIKGRMSRLGWTIDQDKFEAKTPYGTRQLKNIVATLDPSVKRKVVFSCHHDSKRFGSVDHFVGATDSAVPCAMMIDLARQLNSTLWNWSKTQKPEVTLQFMFFDGEEAVRAWTSTDSLYGSRHMVQKLGDAVHDIDVLILLDLIGYKNPTFRNFFESTSMLFQQLMAIERDLAPYLHPHQPYFHSKIGEDRIEDDHMPFMAKGVPILHLICVPFPAVWHKPTDNEENLDYSSIENLNAIMRVFVAQLLGVVQVIPNPEPS